MYEQASAETRIKRMSEITESNTQPPDDGEVEQAIKMLWSADNTVRGFGREEILRIGSATVEPLIKLLSDLIQNSFPRFAAGKEEKGGEALNGYIDLARKAKQPLQDNKDFETVCRLAINTRLISDAIFLLGELRAVEAIPALIHIMERRMNRHEMAGIEMEALSKIGAPAVEPLIKSIEKAEITAADFEPVSFGLRIEIDLWDTADEELPDQQNDSELDDPDFTQAIEPDALLIKRNAIDTVGEIGDKKALPFLENLAETVNNQLLVPGILEAIRKIKNEPLDSTGPQFSRRALIYSLTSAARGGSLIL